MEKIDPRDRWEYQPGAPDACPLCGLVHTGAYTSAEGVRALVCRNGHRWADPRAARALAAEPGEPARRMSEEG